MAQNDITIIIIIDDIVVFIIIIIITLSKCVHCVYLAL